MATMRYFVCYLVALALLLASCAPAPAADRPSPAALPPTAAPAAPPATAAPPAPGAYVQTQDVAALPTPQPTTTPAPAATPSPAGVGAEILFLREGDLLAIGVSAGEASPALGSERLIAEGVRDFAAAPDGLSIALIRGEGAGGEIWLVQRDGSDLRRLTRNTQAEDTPRWTPDAQALTFTVAPEALQRPADWERWSRWCAQAQVALLDLLSGQAQTIGPGCDPAPSPDGLRIAFVTPPRTQPDWLSFPGTNNELLIIDRALRAAVKSTDAGTTTDNGLLVYSPAWSPDSAGVVYHRFLGYQALVDINLTEIGGAPGEAGQPIGAGAGWRMPPVFAPDGRTVAILDHNFSDARGFSGYDIWHLTLLRLGEPGTIVLPSAQYPTDASPIATLQQVAAFAWSPTGDQLAVLLPDTGGPFTDQPLQEPSAPEIGPGTIWLWQPGAPPAGPVALRVDFGSPLAWLPAPPPAIRLV